MVRRPPGREQAAQPAHARPLFGHGIPHQFSENDNVYPSPSTAAEGATDNRMTHMHRLGILLVLLVEARWHSVALEQSPLRLAPG